MNPKISLRPSDDGSFDELVATGVDVHFEMMDDNALWVRVSSETQEYVVWITARGKLTVRAEKE